MILKLGMQHRGLKLYKVYINDDSVLTLTYFTARSNWVAYTFIWRKHHLMRKTLSKGLNWLNNCVNEKKLPWGVVCPCLGLNTCIWPLFSNIFFSETAGSIKAKFHL